MTEAIIEKPSLSKFLDRPLWAALALDWEKAAYFVLIALAAITRFYNLGARVISHDESLHTYYSYELFRGKGFVHTPLMHGTLQFHLLALVFTLFGASDYTSRMPSAAFGLAAVALVWYFRKWLGRTGALAAAGFMLISPFMLYYSRYARNESFVVVWALLMAIALFNYMEARESKWLYLMAAATALLYTTKEVSYIYVAIWMLFLGLIFLRDMFAEAWPNSALKPLFVGSFYLAVAAGLIAAGLFFFGDRMIGQLSATATAAPANPNAPLASPAAPLDAAKQAAAIAFLVMLGLLAAAAVFCFASFREKLRGYPAVDMLVILGTFVLPQLTAFPVKLLLKADPLDYSWAGMLKTASVFVPLMLLSIGIGMLWDWKKWLIAAGVFYGIFIPLFTTMFTNGGGFATGMIGSLGYWLDQQGVQRGSQPWYYYIAVLTPIYEFLPAIGTLTAFGLGAWRWARADDSRQPSAPAQPTRFSPLLFIAFWVVVGFFGYSYAGEKMPWLETHLTLPMILLAGWVFGQILDAIDWQNFKQNLGWAAALVAPLTAYGLLYSVGLLLGATPPFRGNELAQLQATMSFLSAVVVTVGGGAATYLIGRRVGWKQLGAIASALAGVVLAFLTARAAFYASYINYDRQTEFVNYASGAPGVKTVMNQIAEISMRTTDGLGIRVAYDDDVSWPITWYLRDFTGQVFYGGQPTREAFNDTPLIIAGDNNWNRVEPLLGNRYYSFEYIRMWWPMQEYFNLSFDRIKAAWSDPNYREALFDIWFYRDYTKYGQLTNVDYSLSRWPVSDRMRLYVRKDVAAKLWSLGVGPTALEPAPEDPYAKNKQTLFADLVWGSSGAADGQFTSPRAAAVAPNGDVYVADTRGHRIEQFTADGKFLRAWGAHGTLEDNTAAPGAFNEIWGLAVDRQGNVFAADTWNHRIQKFTADGMFLTMWGSFGLAEAGPSVMWGPRGLAVDDAGNVYVADTGNKRILVFDNNGNMLRVIGRVGSQDGELDEPTSVAVAKDGRVFVADTWNQRVQVFSNDGRYLGQWPIAGWYGQSLDNKPYIALDGKGSVFVSDPEGYRVLAFSEGGQFLYSFGDFGADASTFGLPAGLAVGSQALYVVDANNNRVMRFALENDVSPSP